MDYHESTAHTVASKCKYCFTAHLDQKGWNLALSALYLPASTVALGENRRPSFGALHLFVALFAKRTTGNRVGVGWVCIVFV